MTHEGYLTTFKSSAVQDKLRKDSRELYGVYHFFFKSFTKPSLPIPVCLGPKIAANVPSGSDTLLSGINVTLVRPSMYFVIVRPCVAFLPIFHLSFSRTRISCFPVIAGRLELIIRKRDDMEWVEGVIE